MKGFILQMDGKCISGAIDEGNTSIILTCKENKCHVHFGSLDNSGMLSYTWYATDMKTGDCLYILFTDDIRIPEAKEIRDYNQFTEESPKESLELYLKLREELIEDGLI
jgi:hypothetical protein